MLLLVSLKNVLVMGYIFSLTKRCPVPWTHGKSTTLVIESFTLIAEIIVACSMKAASAGNLI